jgi:hypothetical protein
MGAVVTVQYTLGGKFTGGKSEDLSREDLEKIANLLGIMPHSRVPPGRLPTGDNCRYVLVLEVQNQEIPTGNPDAKSKSKGPG